MTHSPEMTLRQQVRVGQIITFFLVQGLVVMSAIMTFLVRSDRQPDSRPGERKPASVEAVEQQGDSGPPLLFPMIVTIFAVTVLLAAWIVPTSVRRSAITQAMPLRNGPLIVPNADQPADAAIHRLLAGDRTARMMGQALFEGLGTIGVVATLIDENLYLLSATAIGIVGVAAFTPTIAKVRQWLESVAASSPGPNSFDP